MAEHQARKHGRRTAFLKQAVIGFGFLSGLWVHLGFDPGTFVYALLQKLLVLSDPIHQKWITLGFLILPVALTLSSVYGAYKRAGVWGLIAVGLAFLAGFFLSVASIALLLAAIVIGYFSARR